MSPVMGPWISRLLFIGPWIIILSNLVEKGKGNSSQFFIIIFFLFNKCLILGECDTPEFIYPIDNITVAAGRDAHFTCVVNKLQGHKVTKLTVKNYFFNAFQWNCQFFHTLEKFNLWEEFIFYKVLLQTTLLR